MTSVIVPPRSGGVNITAPARGSASAVARPPGPRGEPGPQGFNGWTPVLAVVDDGARRVLQVVAWTGGGGDAPAGGQYLGEAGFVSDIALAMEIRGLPGTPGAAATIEINSVTTLPPGEPATIVNVGTDTAALLDIAIPQGATGDIDGLTKAAVETALGGPVVMTINGVAPDAAGDVAIDTGELLASTQQDIGRLFMAVSELKGNQFGTPNGVSDPFTDQDGVDVAGSTNQVWSDVTGTYSNAASGAGAAVAMTSNTAPAGHSVTGYADTPANNYVAFSGKNAVQADNYYQSNFANGCTITRIFPVPVKITQYRMVAPAQPTNWAGLGQPRAWYLYGSNDGSSWTALDNYVVATALNPGQASVRNLTLSASYTHYRWVITASASSTTTFGSYVLIGNIDITLGGTAAAMDLRSIAYESAAPASKGYLVALASGEDPITPGVQLRGFISRNGGADWIEGELVAGDVAGGFTYFEASGVDLSTLPTGTSLKWRLTTTNDVRVTVTSILLMWS